MLLTGVRSDVLSSLIMIYDFGSTHSSFPLHPRYHNNKEEQSAGFDDRLLFVRFMNRAMYMYVQSHLMAI
eukprot:scaffold4628_cov146-Skeletonema_dohrnii-CCMP3373.AAC.14